MRAFVSFVSPGGLLLLAVAMGLYFGLFGDWPQTIARFAPLVLLAFAVVLGWRFNRSRLIFAMLVITLADFFLQGFQGNSPGSALAFSVVATLLPINFILLCCIKERGLLTLVGLWRFLFIALQPLAAVFFCSYQRPVLDRFFESSIVPLENITLPLPQASLFIFASAALILALRFFRNREPLDHGLFWALAAAGLALLAPDPGWRRTLYFSTAGLILVVATFESVHGMAFRDELTGLPARRALNEALLKLGGKYTVAMLDIDFFKKFNDRYGHDAGDQVLRMVAAKLAKVTGGGRSFRYGGEEFTVLFPGRLREETVPHLEKLRKTVAAAGFHVRGANRPARKPGKGKRMRGSAKKVAVTISIGVADCQNGENNPLQVVKAADGALYKAKNGGRNRVAV